MSIKADVFTSQGVKKGQSNLDSAVFGLKDNPSLLAQAIYVYRSNQRQGTKNSQTRSEVSLTTAKVYRQKGTGRSRHGSKRAPIFVGGGVAHGPSGNESYHRSLTKKMRRLSLHTSLSNQAANNAVKIIDQFNFTPKSPTKSAAALLSKIISNFPQKTLIILDTPSPEVIRAMRNLPTVTVTQLFRLNTYEVLNHQNLIFTQNAIKKLSQSLAKSTPSETVTATTEKWPLWT